MNSFDKTSIVIAMILGWTLMGIVKMATDYGVTVEQTRAQTEIARLNHICVPD